MQKLVADMTELKVGVVKLYLSSVIDLYNNEVVAYSIPRSLDMAMIKEMLCRLEESRGGPPPSYIRIVRMLPAGFAAAETPPYPAIGTASQHPDPHSD